ncbi:MAG: serine hydroxymethyltransferase [Elusimicrobia bacterium RIFOXYD2_FULL_34_15]|nr:MAG: serine hydroxymethyltransferase [Elusimicrobia bacterium RIFOXYD2_FULL_34_15]
MFLKKADYEIWEAIQKETRRQCENLELIASENFVSEAVLQAQGSVLTNKYAEGYPDKRYYGGCEFVDIAEKLAIERAKELFKCEHVNVQPHSGTQANMAVYFAVLNIGDTIMGMHLSHGGHLSHGHPANFSGKYFETVAIGVSKKTGLIDYKEALLLAKKHKPKLIVAGTSAYSRIINWQKFRNICDEVGAYLMADIAHYAGLISAGLYPSPIPYADFVTTTTHKTLRGPRGGMIMCKKEYASVIDKTVFPGTQGGPLMHVIAAKAVAFKEALTPRFKKYQLQILKNAKELSSELQKNGFKIVSGGTDSHLMLVDLSDKKLTGLEIEKALDKAGITVNKNSVPFDIQKPFITSGIRVGTPAVTTRGMKEKEMRIIAGFIKQVIIYKNNIKELGIIKNKVRTLCEKFPIYPNRIQS